MDDAIRVLRVVTAALVVISCGAESDGGRPAGTSASNQIADGPFPSRPESCGYYAESPAEPHSANGVAVQFIDLEMAIPACRAAVERDPRNARELTRLARVLETQLSRGERAAIRREMMDALNRAAALNDPRAHLALSRWMTVGAPGFSPDSTGAALHEQRGLAGLRQEAGEGSPQAMVMLGHAIALRYLADDALVGRDEGRLADEADALIYQGLSAGADRLVFDLHEGLRRSGFCDPTTPYDPRNDNNNARESYCRGLDSNLHQSREPVVAYEYTIRMLDDIRRRMEHVQGQTMQVRRDGDATWSLASDDLRRAIERLEYLTLSDNERVAAAARERLPEFRNVQTQLDRMSLASIDAENSAAFIAVLAGAIALAATSRGAGAARPPSYWTPPEFQCTYVDNFGLVATVPC